MKTVELTEATGPLGDYAKHVNEGTVVVTDHGRPVAALVPIENADLETVALSYNPEFLAIIEESRSRLAKEGGIPADIVHKMIDEGE